MVRQVQPLRISKSTSISLPEKSTKINSAASPVATSPSNMASPRPLSEIGSTEHRRNSPSYNQTTRKVVAPPSFSPYVDNSFSSTKDTASPLAFWRDRDPMSTSRFDDSENTPDRELSPGLLSPKRRASIEKLRQAGRVKTSNIFALENKDSYDPFNMPIVERPTTNRPLSQSLLNNSFTRYDSLRKENSPLSSPGRSCHKRSESQSAIQSPGFKSSPAIAPYSGRREVATSPTKSSLARNSQFEPSQEAIATTSWYDRDDGALTPRALHRHHKSVTFHEDPPQVNEYEQPTPEPSVSATSDSREGSLEDSDQWDDDYSFERGSSADAPCDDSFDEDVETANKTPVVLPEDWSRISPAEARTDLVDDGDDVFEGSPVPAEQIWRRSASMASDGESRPLPPLPGANNFFREPVVNATIVRGITAEKHLISPNGPYYSRNEILDTASQSPLPSEGKLKPVESQRSALEPTTGAQEELTITNLDTGERIDVQTQDAGPADDSMLVGLADLSKSPPRISRESILRKVRNNKFEFEGEDEDEGSVATEKSGYGLSYAAMALMDPDEPIPSRETSRETSNHCFEANVDGREFSVEVQIKQEMVDDGHIDLEAIPMTDEFVEKTPGSPSHLDNYERQSSVLRHNFESSGDFPDECSSTYSPVEPEAESTELLVRPQTPLPADDVKETLEDAMQLLTVRDFSGSMRDGSFASEEFVGLPTFLAINDFGLGMGQYTTPSPPPSNESTRQLNIIDNAPSLNPPVDIKPAVKDLPLPAYDGAEFSPPGTPESVNSVLHRDDYETSTMEEPRIGDNFDPRDSPGIPERRATIRTNGKLKARPSATPADLHMMAEQRRLISAEHSVPDIPDQYKNEVDRMTEATECSDAEPEMSDRGSSVPATNEIAAEGHLDSVANTKFDLDIPTLASESTNEGLDLDQEFDRVIEGQKKGYLMRENEKVVVASNRNFSDSSRGTSSSTENANPSASFGANPRPASRDKLNAGKNSKKPSADPYLKTEPWNGKVRRESQRKTSAVPFMSGPAPPLPGQPSALGVVEEDFAAGTSSLEDDVADGVERGRLFVKVVGVKDLDLPLPAGDCLYFQMTLDNGMHCVTTSSLELGKSARIGQEFELVVLNDLEFQLTLSTKLPPPPKSHTATSSLPPKASKQSKSSGLSRFLTSPKKRAERERQEREAAEAEERRLHAEAQRERGSTQHSAWDLLHELVNESDGAFARAYVNLKAHEKQCFGRQLTVDVPCYNEWALEKDSAVVNSVRSKRGYAGLIRKPPYVVGNLEVQLLYVPRPAGAADEEMPRSMSSAMREMSKAVEVKEIAHEGHLSQQGGDCVHWRRRFFNLRDAKLTAYHEHTHQKRAVINLSKATRLVDDKSTLIADPKSGNPHSKHGRRKSAFAEEDEGYQYVEEGFRIRFANGETIDFYADNTAEKDAWMKALGQVIGKPDPVKKAATWTDLVLARERAQGRPVPSTTQVRDFTKPLPPLRTSSQRKAVSKSVPNSPEKNTASAPRLPSPPQSDILRPKTPPMNPRRGHRSRDAVKSMIF